MAFLAGPRLLDWASSPPHLQFNKFVLTGYRPASSGPGCLRSLFYLHNELGNIYTHGKQRPASHTATALPAVNRGPEGPGAPQRRGPGLSGSWHGQEPRLQSCHCPGQGCPLPLPQPGP